MGPHTTVVYHKNCLDGFGAAFAYWLLYGDAGVEYVALDYSDRDRFIADWKWQPQMKEIVILDFSFSAEHTDFLIDHSASFTLLDHHKTAFENLAEQERNYFVDQDAGYFMLLDNSKSGAMLAWEFFHPDSEVPQFIQAIDDRDRWIFAHKDTKAFCLALSQLPQDFNVWQGKVFDKGFYELVTAGETIQGYFNTQLERMLDATKESCNILGAAGLCANLPPMFASEAGNILATLSGTYGATWYKCSDGSVKWSLRSNGDYDVSELAKQFGGGGHKNAAGFVLHPESGLSQPGVTIWNHTPSVVAWSKSDE